MKRIFNLSSFIEIEKKNGLLDDKIDGFPYWAYRRSYIYQELIKKNDLNHSAPFIQWHKPTFNKLITAVKNCIFCNPFFRSYKCDVLIIPHQRRVMTTDGTYKCIYTDDVIKKLNCKVGIIEFMYNFRHLKPTQVNGIIPMDYIEIMPVISYKLKKILGIINKKKYTEKASLIHKIFYDEYGININEKQFAIDIEKAHYYYMGKKKELKRLIKIMAPKVIVEVVGYDYNKLIINEIAKEYHIKTIELQHGVIGPGHIAYNFAESKKYNFFPDSIFVFSEYWKRSSKFPIDSDNVIVTGYPYLEEQVQKYPKIIHSLLTIIALSQPQDDSEFLDLIIAVAKLLKYNNIKFHIIYKLHPSEIGFPEKKWLALKSVPEIEVIDTRNISLYSLFAVSDVQIGMYSTAIYEGLSYGLRTAIYYSQQAESVIGDICKLGYAKMCYAATDIYEYIVNEQPEKIEKNTNVTNDFFVTDALNTMVNEINKCL